MNRNVTFVWGLLFSLAFLGQPANTTDGQRSDSLPITAENKKTTADVQLQENIKQNLFQQAFKNQDTVTLLINKKSKPRIVHIYKRVPVIIPIAIPENNYVSKAHDTIAVLNNYKYNTKNEVVKDSLIIVVKPQKRKGFFYRLLHRN